MATETAFLGLEELASHLGVAREAARLWLETFETVTGEALPRGERRARLAPLEVADLLKRAVAVNRETDLPREEAIRAELHSPPPGGGLEEALAAGIAEALDRRLEPLLDQIEREATGRLEAVQARLDQRVNRHLQEATKHLVAQVSIVEREISKVAAETRSALEANLTALSRSYAKGVESVDRTAHRFDLAERELVAIAQQLDASAAHARDATSTLRVAVNDLAAARRALRSDAAFLAHRVALAAGVGGIVSAGSVVFTSRLIATVAQQGAAATVALLLGLFLALVTSIAVTAKLLH